MHYYYLVLPRIFFKKKTPGEGGMIKLYNLSQGWTNQILHWFIQPIIYALYE